MYGNDKSLSLGVEITNDTLGHDLVLREIAARGIRYCVSANWESDHFPEETHLSDLGVPLLYQRSYMKTKDIRSTNWQRFTWGNDDVVIDIASRDNSQSSFTVYADDHEIAVGWINKLRELYPAIKPEGDSHLIDMHFWSLGPRGPEFTRRKLTVPKWEEVSTNYTYPTYTGLSKMMDPSFRPESLVSGQLMLWYGPPGTGKTYAIRALANEWRKWCDFEYVVDPEKFFGMEASYLMNVIIGDHKSFMVDDDDEEEAEQRWRTLIFEDTGELLSADAKERSGQGLSRLLNLVDGIIGQGLRILVLITTNEDLGKFHPAVARPGRISSTIRFGDLDKTESSQWAAEHGLTIEKRSHTIAELFDEAHGTAIRAAPEPVKTGFQPR